MKIIVLGSNGMLGRYVCSYFNQKEYNVIGITRKELDVLHLREEELKYKLFDFGLENGDVIINCIGMIKQRTDINDIDFIYINSIFPRLLSNVCEKLNVKMIHPTTDCVFDGLSGNYNENDLHNATDVYGKTKSLGEPNNCTVIRTSIIGEEVNQNRSLIEWVKSNKDKTIKGYTNHYWNGVTCLQFAKICEEIIVNNLYWDGVKHIYTPNYVSKYQLVSIINDVFDLNITIEPFETEVKCDRTLNSLYNVPFDIPDLHEQIEEMKIFNINNGN